MRSSRGTRATTVDGLNVDLIALVSLLVGVDVVKLSTQTLPPDVLGTNGKSLVGAKGEASSIFSPSLGGSIELELVIGGDIASSASLVLQDTALESEAEGTR